MTVLVPGYKTFVWVVGKILSFNTKSSFSSGISAAILLSVKLNSVRWVHWPILVN